MHFATRLKPTTQALDLTPLVDVIFLLLIFFIVTSDTLPFKSLPVQPTPLPVDSSALTAQLAVIIDAHEVIYVGSKKTIVELDTLKKTLEREIQHYQQLNGQTIPSIVLQIDRRVSYEIFLQAFYAAEQLGLPIRLAYHYSENMNAAP